MIFKEASTGPTYSQIFGKWLCEMAARDPTVVGITPAMREGSGLVEFSKRFPERYYDVAIAEQHAVTFAAGLACEGMKPVLAIYSTFLQRGYDQLIHDVCIQNLPIVFALDRAGLVGGDGATHNGAFDLTYLRCVPNMAVMAPSDENECRQMLTTAFSLGRPAAVRYPRGSGPGAAVAKEMQALPFGKGVVRRRSRSGGVAILSFGSLLKPALEAAEDLDATVADMRFVKPLDWERAPGHDRRERRLRRRGERGGRGAGRALDRDSSPSAWAARSLRRSRRSDAIASFDRPGQGRNRRRSPRAS
jgi:1-deoxy-D-xylulose-5-phosphate synthase